MSLREIPTRQHTSTTKIKSTKICPIPVNRTPCHMACTNVNTLSAQRIVLICYTLTRGSRLMNCVPKHFLNPSLVSRHVSRPAHHTQHFVLYFTVLYFSFAHRLTGSGSRLFTSRIHCANSQGLGGDSFTDPEPRTTCEPNRVVDSLFSRSSLSKRLNTLLKTVRFHKLRIRTKIDTRSVLFTKETVIVVFDSRFCGKPCHASRGRLG